MKRNLHTTFDKTNNFAITRFIYCKIIPYTTKLSVNIRYISQKLYIIRNYFIIMNNIKSYDSHCVKFKVRKAFLLMRNLMVYFISLNHNETYYSKDNHRVIQMRI